MGMANTIALNEDAKVKFKVGYESTLLDENTKIYKTKSPGTVYFAIKQDTVDPEKGLVGSIYYDIDDETVLRGFLGRMLFSGDEVFKNVGVLSGGEKTRLSLVSRPINSSPYSLDILS